MGFWIWVVLTLHTRRMPKEKHQMQEQRQLVRQYYIIACVTMVVLACSTSPMALVLKNQGLSQSTGMVMGVFGLAQVVACCMTNNYLQRWGGKKCLIACFAIISLCVTSYGIIRDPIWLTGIRVGHGYALGVVMTAIIILIREVYPTDQKKALTAVSVMATINAVFSGFAAFGAYWFVTEITDTTWGLSVWGGICGLLGVLPLVQVSHMNVPLKRSFQPKSQGLKAWVRKTFDFPSYGICLISMGTMAAYQAYGSYLPLYHPMGNAILLVASMVMIFTSRLAGGMINKWESQIDLLVVLSRVLVLLSLGCVCLGSMSWWWLIPSALFMGLGIKLDQNGTSQKAVLVTSEHKRPIASTAMSVAINGGYSLGNFLGGYWGAPDYGMRMWINLIYCVLFSSIAAMVFWQWKSVRKWICFIHYISCCFEATKKDRLDIAVGVWTQLLFCVGSCVSVATIIPREKRPLSD